jgi:hypothetical protein
MEKRTKIIIGILAVAAIGTGAFLYLRKKKKDKEESDKALEEEKVAETSTTEETSTSENPAPPKNETVKAEPKTNNTFVGKTIKSRGTNKLKTYQIKDVAKDVKQKDGTYKRIVTKSYVEVGGGIVFKDGEVIGTVRQDTKTGFYINSKLKNIVWASKSQAIV